MRHVDPHPRLRRDCAAALLHADRLAQQAEATRLGDAIAELASRIHAATYELLVLIRQFDACGA